MLMGPLPAGFNCAGQRKQDLIQLRLSIRSDHDFRPRAIPIAPVSHLRTCRCLGGDPGGALRNVFQHIPQARIKLLSARAAAVGPMSEKGTDVIGHAIPAPPGDGGTVTAGTVDSHSAFFGEKEFSFDLQI
jgi:hypothetical protein